MGGLLLLLLSPCVSSAVARQDSALLTPLDPSPELAPLALLEVGAQIQAKAGLEALLSTQDAGDLFEDLDDLADTPAMRMAKEAHAKSTPSVVQAPVGGIQGGASALGAPPTLQTMLGELSLLEKQGSYSTPAQLMSPQGAPAAVAQPQPNPQALSGAPSFAELENSVQAQQQQKLAILASEGQKSLNGANALQPRLEAVLTQLPSSQTVMSTGATAGAGGKGAAPDSFLEVGTALDGYLAVAMQTSERALLMKQNLQTQRDNLVAQLLEEKTNMLDWIAAQKAQAVHGLEQMQRRLTELSREVRSLQSMKVDSQNKQLAYLEQHKKLASDTLHPEESAKGIQLLQYYETAAQKVLQDTTASLEEKTTALSKGYAWHEQTRQGLVSFLQDQQKRVETRLKLGREQVQRLQEKMESMDKLASEARERKEQYEKAIKKVELEEQVAAAKKELAEKEANEHNSQQAVSLMEESRTRLSSHLSSLQQSLQQQLSQPVQPLDNGAIQLAYMQQQQQQQEAYLASVSPNAFPGVGAGAVSGGAMDPASLQQALLNPAAVPQQQQPAQVGPSGDADLLDSIKEADRQVQIAAERLRAKDNKSGMESGAGDLDDLSAATKTALAAANNGMFKALPDTPLFGNPDSSLDSSAPSSP